MWNAVLDIMKEKAAAGVDVRLMYDDLGTIQTLPPHYYRQMEEAGTNAPYSTPFARVSIPCSITAIIGKSLSLTGMWASAGD